MMKKLRWLSLIFIVLIFLGSNSTSRSTIAVGIFSDYGAWPTGWGEEYSELLKAIITALDPGCSVRLITAADIIEDVADKLDVVIFPGGSGDTQSETMGEEGRHKIRAFIQKGGGYIGICAGAYLAQHSNRAPDLSLRISQTRLYDNAKNWDRGGAIAEVNLTPEGRALLPELKGKKSFYIYYYQGPLLVPLRGQRKNYQELMTYKSNIYHKRPRAKGESPGKTFMLREKHGKGTVVLMAGHPEFSPGLYWLLPRMVRLAVNKNHVTYPRRFVRPAFTREIMFNKRWEKWQKRYVKDLERDWAPWLKIRAMRNLRAIGSYEVCQYVEMLLTDPAPAVRREAAAMIKTYDYFPAVDELREAYRLERVRWVKKAMRSTLQHLTIHKKPRKKKTASRQKVAK